jgi:hypothetical protein
VLTTTKWFVFPEVLPMAFQMLEDNTEVFAKYPVSMHFNSPEEFDGTIRLFQLHGRFKI